jgi:hypothetical protein
MKKIICTVLFAFTLLSVTKAQIKAERFCKISVLYKTEKRQKISVDYGNIAGYSMPEDSAVISSLEKVKDYINDIDALNYMNSLGWEFVKIVSLTSNGKDEYICFFKKTFEK